MMCPRNLSFYTVLLYCPILLNCHTVLSCPIVLYSTITFYLYILLHCPVSYFNVNCTVLLTALSYSTLILDCHCPTTLSDCTVLLQSYCNVLLFCPTALYYCTVWTHSLYCPTLLYFIWVYCFWSCSLCCDQFVNCMHDASCIMHVLTMLIIA